MPDDIVGLNIRYIQSKISCLFRYSEEKRTSKTAAFETSVSVSFKTTNEQNKILPNVGYDLIYLILFPMNVTGNLENCHKTTEYYCFW